MAKSQRPSAAPALSIARGAAVRRRFGSKGIIFAFGFARIPQERTAGARKRFGVLFVHRSERRNEREGIVIWSLRIKIERFFADGNAHSAAQHLAVIVNHLPERSLINHGLLLLPAFTLFALVGSDGHAAKFDPFDGAPRVLLAVENLNAVESGVFERVEEKVFAERPGDATAQEVGVLQKLDSDDLVGEDVGVDGA